VASCVPKRSLRAKPDVPKRGLRAKLNVPKRGLRAKPDAECLLHYPLPKAIVPNGFRA